MMVQYNFQNLCNIFIKIRIVNNVENNGNCYLAKRPSYYYFIFLLKGPETEGQKSPLPPGPHVYDEDRCL